MDLNMNNNYYHLPIYKEMYGLLLDVFKRVEKLDREYKHTIGERLKNECLDILKNIYQASRTKRDTDKKSVYLNEILDSIVQLKVLFRILKDLGIISTKNHVSFQEKIESVSKQATGWSSAGVS
jgi:hypothetical protein